MKDLFVTADCSRSGVGSRLMRAVAAFAVQHGHKRLDWTAARANVSLLDYYESFGAVKQEDKVFFRLMGETLEALAASRES